MAGLSMTQYLDWALNTGPIFLSGTDNIVNNVSRRSFALGEFLRGKSHTEILQGGNKIKETLYLKANRTFQTFKRNADVSWQNPQKDQTCEIDWRFTLDHMSWDEAEYILQTAGLSGSDLSTKYKDMAYSKEQRLWESMVDGWEDLLWQAPNGATQYAEMEGANGGEPYSLPVFVHENSSNNGGFDSNWLLTETLTQATYSANWDNKRATYDATDPLDAAQAATGLMDGFDDIAFEIGYESPGLHDEAFEEDSGYGGGNKRYVAQNHIICTSKRGMKQIMRVLRNSNDHLITPQDGSYPLPRWNGVPIKDVSALDSAALYLAEDSSSYVAEAAAGGTSATNVNASGARYYFFNTKYLKMVFHRSKYFKKEASPRTPERKVGVYICPVECWGNLVCTGRRWQGIVSPAA